LPALGRDRYFLAALFCCTLGRARQSMTGRRRFLISSWFTFCPSWARERRLAGIGTKANGEETTRCSVTLAISPPSLRLTRAARVRNCDEISRLAEPLNRRGKPQ